MFQVSSTASTENAKLEPVTSPARISVITSSKIKAPAVLLARLHASVTIPGIRGTIAALHIAMDDEGADVVHALSDAVKCMFV